MKTFIVTFLCQSRHSCESFRTCSGHWGPAIPHTTNQDAENEEEAKRLTAKFFREELGYQVLECVWIKEAS
jgi:hypothetical protein